VGGGSERWVRAEGGCSGGGVPEGELAVMYGTVVKSGSLPASKGVRRTLVRREPRSTCYIPRAFVRAGEEGSHPYSSICRGGS